MKTETAWVIQRDDGYFLKDCPRKFAEFTAYIGYSEFCMLERSAEDYIKRFELQNCKLVKVEIKVVEE